MAERRLKHFGWGREGEGMTAEEVAVALDRYRRLFGVERFDEAAPPALGEIELRPPRLLPPRRASRKAPPLTRELLGSSLITPTPVRPLG